MDVVAAAVGDRRHSKYVLAPAAAEEVFGPENHKGLLRTTSNLLMGEIVVKLILTDSNTQSESYDFIGYIKSDYRTNGSNS